MQDYWEEEPKPKKTDRKKILIIAAIAIVSVMLLGSIIIYIGNESAREWIDKNLFRKEIKQDNATVIELKEKFRSASIKPNFSF